jgi:L-amino acid N-acyltransferase YncA
MIQILLASSSELPRIVEISNWAAEHLPANFATKPETLESWSKSFEETQAFYPWLVAKEGEEVVGFAKASPHKSRGAYAWTAEVSVYIDVAHHKKGIGSLLYKALLPLLQAQNYATLIAGIVVGQAGSEALHSKVGFTRCGTFHRVGWKFDRWYDVGYWELHFAHKAPLKILPVLEAWQTLQGA